MKLDDIKRKESPRHYIAKKLLFEWIVDGHAKFVTQDNKIYDSNKFTWEFASMESLAYKDDMSGVSFQPYIWNCFCCNGQESKYDGSEIEYIDHRIINHNELNKNTYIRDPENDIQAFYNHPCNYCSFKNELDILYIFDIGLVHKGVYKYVFEIEYTSPVKKNKIAYCKSNQIDLFIIKWGDILSSKLESGYFKARIL